MSIALYILILWVLHPISVFGSLLVRFRKRIPIFNVDNNKWFKDWKKIRIFGLIASTSLIIYVIIIVVLGWTFRSYYGLLILQVVLFLTIDRYLISVNYGKTFWESKSVVNKKKFIFTKTISYLYIIGRLCYIVYCILAFPILFVAQTGFTVDTFIYGIYGEIVDDSKLLVKHTPFGTEVNYADGLNKVYSNSSYFDGKVIFFWEESSPEIIYLFISKMGIFMKYANPSHNFIYYDVDFNQLEYDDDSNTLYLDSNNSENRSRIENLNGELYLEYYTMHFDHNTGKRVEIPVRIKL